MKPKTFRKRTWAVSKKDYQITGRQIRLIFLFHFHFEFDTKLSTKFAKNKLL